MKVGDENSTRKRSLSFSPLHNATYGSTYVSAHAPLTIRSISHRILVTSSDHPTRIFYAYFAILDLGKSVQNSHRRCLIQPLCLPDLRRNGIKTTIGSGVYDFQAKLSQHEYKRTCSVVTDAFKRTRRYDASTFSLYFFFSHLSSSVYPSIFICSIIMCPPNQPKPQSSKDSKLSKEKGSTVVSFAFISLFHSHLTNLAPCNALTLNRIARSRRYSCS